MNTEAKKERMVRVSPYGMIMLTTAMRRALGVNKRVAFGTAVTVEKGTVRLTPAKEGESGVMRVSRGGLAQLPRDAFQALTGGRKGRYTVALNERAVTLRA